MDNKELLQKAVGLIKAWHNMDSVGKLPPDAIEQMWQIYYNRSPEMKEIREALQG